MMSKVIRDGKVAVLVSPGYGAGWYSWNTEYPEILFDPIVVDAIERKLPIREIETYLKDTYPNIHLSGYCDLEIQWIPEGTQFKIDEYDGYETLMAISNITWFTA